MPQDALQGALQGAFPIFHHHQVYTLFGLFFLCPVAIAIAIGSE
jgi:hypothetical protein